MQPIDLLGHVFGLAPPLQRRLLTVGVPRILPITRGLGLRVEELSDDRSELSMPLSRRSRNHVGSVYLGATLILAEVTMALLVYRLLRPPRYRVLVLANEAAFPARGDGRLRAECAPGGEELATLAACQQMAPGRTDLWLTSTVRREDGEVACRARFHVDVKRREGR